MRRDALQQLCDALDAVSVDARKRGLHTLADYLDTMQPHLDLEAALLLRRLTR